MLYSVPLQALFSLSTPGLLKKPHFYKIPHKVSFRAQQGIQRSCSEKDSIDGIHEEF